MPTRQEKADYVRSQGQTRNHHCHWPDCDEQVPPAQWGCKKHWFKLPKYLRDRVWMAFQPGQEVNGTPSMVYLKIAREVREWILTNHPETRLSKENIIEKLTMPIAKKTLVAKIRKNLKPREPHSVAENNAVKKYLKGKQPTKSLWDGPEDDGPNGGITFSLLSKFLVCRERFRLRVVEGLREEHVFNKSIEYGNFHHAAEETYLKFLGNRTSPKDKLDKRPIDKAIEAMSAHRRHLLHEYPDEVSEIDKQYALCKKQFPLYIAHWATHPIEKSRTPLVQEAVFKVPYKLPSGRTVILRGKFDSIDLMPTAPMAIKVGENKWLSRQPTNKRPKFGIYIQENKTKGKIDEEGLLATVAQNLQTMMYYTVLEKFGQPGDHYLGIPIDAFAAFITAFDKYGIGGVLYNVLRRPLADFHAIKQRSGREVNKKVNGKTVMANGKPVKVRVGVESVGAFYNRVEQQIKDNPNDFFMRWKVELDMADLATFKTQMFDPILESLCQWWDWIRVDPFNPWRPRLPSELDSAIYHGIVDESAREQIDETTPLTPCPHYQAPFGVYNGMYDGMRGDYFEYLTSGRDYGLERVPSLFPELT